ncbi:hypothetical protein CSQ87_03530 [Bifidobacterium simiarum]|uniref:HTH lacI-type domain-containing protein n=2 Tax=Bifidobacterium simiarum TaxID=2045441 RepID=A0A2M9HFB7_9BIFI|nr:hypothetical protein CSQ87_03530 [Bifidobacterium simiarum]
MRGLTFMTDGSVPAGTDGVPKVDGGSAVLSGSAVSGSAVSAGGRASGSRKGPAKTSRVNIRDIAAAAGVSTATVSRVMRGNAKVSEATRAKVRKAIDDLEYIPNAHALALTTPPNSVTLVVDSIVGGTYSEMTAGVEREAAAHNMVFRLISTGGNWSEPEPLLNELLSQRPRVVVLTATDIIGNAFDGVLDQYVEKFASVGTTLVVLARPRMGLSQDIAVVDYANESGMEELTKYMISLGHRKFMFAGLRENSSVFMARYRGFRKALEEAGLDYDPSFEIPLDDDRSTVMANMMASWQSGASDCTAVVAVTDAMALFSIAGLRKLGVSVPDDVSVGGFDDMPFAEDLVVPMTTVHAPFGDMGRMAVRVGLEHPGASIVMPTNLAIRGSVAVPRRS